MWVNLHIIVILYCLDFDLSECIKKVKLFLLLLLFLYFLPETSHAASPAGTFGSSYERGQLQGGFSCPVSHRWRWREDGAGEQVGLDQSSAPPGASLPPRSAGVQTQDSCRGSSSSSAAHLSVGVLHLQENTPENMLSKLI